jgi:hypothetical protein
LNNDIKNIIQEVIFETLNEELCARGKAYIKARKAAGEKSSAYLSGRAVKVCKGQISFGGKKTKSYRESIDTLTESLRNWFEKEDWVRIDTQGNITGPCGTMKKGKATTRCLPRAKANRLTKAQRAATARKKVAGSKKGKQFVSNTPKAKVKFRKK